MKRTGPDSVRSWTIAFYCSLISMLLYGVVRLSGIMFVASMQHFQADRQSSSLPYVLCDFLQAMTGPVTGFLSLKFGARQVMTLGSFVAAIGTGACFFAQNIETVSVLWGFVYGFGFGLSSLLLPAIITQHFVKRRATAISLVFVGSYLGFSFLPSIADLLIHTYGLSGTYLFLSGFLLQCVPLCMLLRSPDKVHVEKISGTERSSAARVSIIDKYPPCAVKESGCGLNNETLYDIRSRNFKTENETNIKNSDTLSFKTITQHRSNVEDDNSKRRLSIEFLDCGDLQNMTNSSISKQCKKGINNECFMQDSTAEYDQKVKPDATKNSNSEKEIDDINQTRQIASNVQSPSCFERDNISFSKGNLKKSDQNPFWEGNVFNIVTKFRNTKIPENCDKKGPNLLNIKRIGSFSDIYQLPSQKKYYSDIPYPKNVETLNKSSNGLFPVFVNPKRKSGTVTDESRVERPMKPNYKSTAKQDRLKMRRTSTISKQELTTFKGLNIFLEPIFLLVLLSSAVYSSSFIAFITVIVDFSTDIGILESDGKFVILVFSIASNIGLLSFGWVTDCGYFSLTNFSALMFSLRTITLSVIPFSKGFGMLTTVVALQGFFEASLANMSSLIVSEYYIDEIHELAISCTLFLCGPMYLGTPLLIGFFRDGLGSYLYLFLLMATLSFICSILHFIAPALAKCRCGRDDWILRKKES